MDIRKPKHIYEGSHTLDRTDYDIKATTRWNSIIAATGDMAMSDEVTIRLKIITRGESPRKYWPKLHQKMVDQDLMRHMNCLKKNIRVLNFLMKLIQFRRAYIGKTEKQ